MASQLYRLEWNRRVRRQFQAVPTRIRQDVKQFVLDLRIHPYADPSESLNRELADLRRIKIDGWRIIYKVNEADRVVRVLAVKQRGSRHLHDNLLKEPPPRTVAPTLVGASQLRT